MLEAVERYAWIEGWDEPTNPPVCEPSIGLQSRVKKPTETHEKQ